MTKDDRRPDGWTSADAAGLAILPGLVRYDEAWNPAVAEIGHAFRVTVRATNGYVYPASHRAGSTPGALPMGARLRLKPSVAGEDPALRSADPNIRKIFRAMQKHGLIVADNGSDLYVTGTFDVRWNNDVLNPAFALLTASDFDVVALGWKPADASNAVAGLAVAPASVAGGTRRRRHGDARGAGARGRRGGRAGERGGGRRGAAVGRHRRRRKRRARFRSRRPPVRGDDGDDAVGVLRRSHEDGDAAWSRRRRRRSRHGRSRPRRCAGASPRSRS